MISEARAQKKSIQSSPRKMRLMLDMIRGKRVPEALSILHFTPNHASNVAEMTVRSAVANFQLKPENGRFDIEDLYIRECYSDGGPMLKRVLPAPMGRAFRVRKRSNHLTIVVGEQLKSTIKTNTRAKKAQAAKNGGAGARSGAGKTGAQPAEAKKSSSKKKVEASAS